jgi:hypothetical protein
MIPVAAAGGRDGPRSIAERWLLLLFVMLSCHFLQRSRVTSETSRTEAIFLQRSRVTSETSRTEAIGGGGGGYGPSRLLSVGLLAMAVRDKPARGSSMSICQWQRPPEQDAFIHAVSFVLTIKKSKFDREEGLGRPVKARTEADDDFTLRKDRKGWHGSA